MTSLAALEEQDLTKLALLEDRVLSLVDKIRGPATVEKVRRSFSDLTDLAKMHGYAQLFHRLNQPDKAHPVVEYKYQPVSMKEFMKDTYFMGGRNNVWPLVLEELYEINSGKYEEVVFTGGIGSAKTTGAIFTTAYQVYLLSCLLSPHETYDLDQSSEILFIFQSLNKTLSTDVDYTRFRHIISDCPYFQEMFPFEKDRASKMVFPNRIEITPLTGAETGAIGQNVIGGIMDELNYMAVIENSKSSVDGGTYDQAIALYNSISRRRKSRFMKKGKLPGILCLVSSKRYPGQFTDQKEEERRKDIETKGSSTIYVYDKRTWQIKPDDYSGNVFHVFIGDSSRKPRVMEPGEKVHPQDRELVMAIPEEHRTDFDRDLINALREVAGVSTLAKNPFILDISYVADAMGRTQSVITADKVDFEQTHLKVMTKRLRNKECLRFAHVDLGLTGDSAGVAVGHVPEFVVVERGDFKEVMPLIVYDLLLEVAPPRNGEIQFWKIRKLFATLRDLGLPLRWVTYDSYQSIDSLQLLRQQGFITGQMSMDTSTLPYEILKTAMYDGRVWAPENKKAQTELMSLERDPKNGKIDHPANGSKDLSDAMAGVAYGLTMRRKVWLDNGVPLGRIPKSLIETMDREQLKDDRSILLKRKAA